MAKPFFEIPYYHDYISPELAEALLQEAKPLQDDLLALGESGGLETKEALSFLTNLYDAIKPELQKVLAQRILDREFIDARVAACHTYNQEQGIDLLSPNYKTVLGLEDANGRIVIGPNSANYCRSGGEPVAPLPEYLKGPHVTLFGPPDSAKMAINAMNAYHRKLANEPKIVAELLQNQKSSPMWGADDEDSKTPLRADLIDAAVNLTKCFAGTLSLEEKEKSYQLARDHLALPIKRFPGLALPATFLFYKKNPIPLHLYDFALHLFHNWADPKALVFYVPKLENEEEAKYIHSMIAQAERAIKAEHPSYQLGTVRLMIVLENPRAILRTHEIMDALYPYFAGASLGWHDYLASTARLLKEDSNYRIPVKADPNIVIKYIKASHRMLAEVVGSRGGIKVGGMYGILPLNADLKTASFQITLKGYIKDVITQLKRDLTGFWVAHPDFVRLGLAFVEAWRRHEKGDKGALTTLVTSLLHPEHHEEILTFIAKPDIEGLDPNDPQYVRSLIVADIKESDYIPNNHPDEIRYNVFQSLQYLTDWLSGSGCVALPTVIEGVPVRIMDDLATAERSRWEVWHELHHQRFSLEDFIKITHEEMNFIRRDLSNEQKIVQVKWNERTAKWYPIALELMLKLMTDPNPVEFATELLMPFTVDSIRNAQDPWAALQKIDRKKYALPRHVAQLHHYFSICGSLRFAQAMAQNSLEDQSFAQKIIQSFSKKEINEAAFFHGNIGENKATLDPIAAKEQAMAQSGAAGTLDQLKKLGEDYIQKFGMKFLISAQGRSSEELLAALKARLKNTESQELENARQALWEISQKRMGLPAIITKIQEFKKKYNVIGASIALNYHNHTQSLTFGEASKGGDKVTKETKFELASLSKTIGSAFAIEYFQKKKIPLTTSVNTLFAKTKSPYRIISPANPAWADQVTIEHLMSHSALNMHYVVGTPINEHMPKIESALGAIKVLHEPGKKFAYSGGGFIVLEHLLEALEEKSIQELTKPFLKSLGIENITFDHQAKSAHGYLDSGEEVRSSRLNFPAFAAGALGTASHMAKFLKHLSDAFHKLEGSGGISHNTAVRMLHGTDKGCRAFMGCDMGIGVFVAEAGKNRFAIHQGSNEGFRSIFLQCFQGPDRGFGLVIFCNSDNKGVLFNGEVAQTILAALNIQGIDDSKFLNHFAFQEISQEQIVNIGYKKLIFDAFQPDLPEEILVKGPLDPLANYNLATKAKITSVSNQKFARAENLISAYLPVFDPQLFGRQGKIMDSWETARHNESLSDSLILEFQEPQSIRYLSLSTKYHDGNQAEKIALSIEEGSQWQIFFETKAEGHASLAVDLEKKITARKIKVEIFPDGGLSRIGLFTDLPERNKTDFRPHSTWQRFKDIIPKTKKPLTIPFVENKIQVLRASNEHYGPAAQVISPFPPLHMFDGLESARSREPGHHEEVTLKLNIDQAVEKILLDFTYFVNNNPLYVSIEGKSGSQTKELIAKTKVKAFAGNKLEFVLENPEKLHEITVKTFPDGGINRIRINDGAH